MVDFRDNLQNRRPVGGDELIYVVNIMPGMMSKYHAR